MNDDDLTQMTPDELLQVIKDLRGKLKGYLTEQWDTEAQAKKEALIRKRANAYADEVLQAEALAEIRGAREARFIEDLANEPPKPQVIQGVLAAEVNLLGGPSEAGKSLLARDWSMHVAAGVPWHGHDVIRSNVLYIASEGMHDIQQRWVGHPLWAQAKGSIKVLDPISLPIRSDVDWLIEAHADFAPGLIVFDVIYGMGMSDDNGVKDTLPVLNAMKRISAEMECATLALGHPPLNEKARRFRGSGSWRQLAYVEWHMADNLLTCEKSKIAHKEALTERYMPAYPSLTWLTPQEAGAMRDERRILIDLDFDAHPDDSIRARAARLAPVLGVSVERARALISQESKARGETQ